jgi:hypothetical protein
MIARAAALAAIVEAPTTIRSPDQAMLDKALERPR